MSYQQAPPMPATAEQVGEVVKRASRIEAAAWIAMGFSIATFGVVVYWSIVVIKAVHDLQKAFSGIQ